MYGHAKLWFYTGSFCTSGKCCHGNTKIRCASENNNVLAVATILELGCDNVNMPDEDDGFNPLIVAALEGYNEILNLLVSFKGIDINYQCKSGYSALMVAAAADNVEIVRVLLERGCDPNLKNICGFTALIIAAEKGHVNVVEALLSNKNVLVDETDLNGGTALAFAAEMNHVDIVTMLIDRGSDINIQNDRGYTACMWAVKKGNVDVIKSFLASGYNLEIQNSIGRTVLHMACTSNLNFVTLYDALHIINMLLVAGSNENVKDYYGNKALDYLSDIERDAIQVRITYTYTNIYLTNNFIGLQTGAKLATTSKHRSRSVREWIHQDQSGLESPAASSSSCI